MLNKIVVVTCPMNVTALFHDLYMGNKLISSHQAAKSSQLCGSEVLLCNLVQVLGSRADNSDDIAAAVNVKLNNLPGSVTSAVDEVELSTVV